MTEANPPRSSPGGTTTLADIVGVASPAQAPNVIRFPAAMTALFTAQFRASFPGGKPKEQGGTIVADAAGNFSIQRLGGLGSNDGEISFDMRPTDPAKYTAVGMFHTHPYGKDAHWAVGVPLSGGDCAALIDDKYIISAVQSGPHLFVCIKTARSPKWIDQKALHTAGNEDVAQRLAAGQSLQAGSQSVSRKIAGLLALAFYQGANGVVTRL